MAITFTTGRDAPANLDGYDGPVVDAMPPSVQRLMAEIAKLPGGDRMVSEVEAWGPINVNVAPPTQTLPTPDIVPWSEPYTTTEGGGLLPDVGPAVDTALKEAKRGQFSLVGGLVGLVGGGLLLGRWGAIVGGAAGALFGPKGVAKSQGVQAQGVPGVDRPMTPEEYQAKWNAYAREADVPGLSVQAWAGPSPAQYRAQYEAQYGK